MLSRFNLSSGVIVSSLRSASVSSFTASGTTNCPKNFTGSCTLYALSKGSHLVDPVLGVTVYAFKPIDAERLFNWSDLFPAPTFDLSLSSPTSNFYFGFSSELFLRNFQAVYGVPLTGGFQTRSHYLQLSMGNRQPYIRGRNLITVALSGSPSISPDSFKASYLSGSGRVARQTCIRHTGEPAVHRLAAAGQRGSHKRVFNPYPADTLAGVQVLGDDCAGSALQRTSHDESVPEADTRLVLDAKGAGDIRPASPPLPRSHRSPPRAAPRLWTAAARSCESR